MRDIVEGVPRNATGGRVLVAESIEYLPTPQESIIDADARQAAAEEKLGRVV